MRSRLFSGEVPAPSTLIAVYLVARVSLDALAGLAPHYAGAQSSHAAVKRGALSALVESVCVWGVCHDRALRTGHRWGATCSRAVAARCRKDNCLTGVVGSIWTVLRVQVADYAVW